MSEQDIEDQWKKRKQTKEESQAAKRAKLDPDQPVTVKEVEEERARQRTEREDKRRKLNEDGVPYETKSQMKARQKEERRKGRREKKQKGEKETQTESTSQPEENGPVEPESKPTVNIKHDSIGAQKSSKTAVASPSKEQHHPAKRKDAKPNGVQLKVNGTQRSGKAIVHNPKPEPPQKSDGEGNGELLDGLVKMDEGSSSEEEEAEAPSDDDSDTDEDGNSIQRINGLTSTTEETGASPSPAPSNTTDTSTAQKTLAEKLKNSKDPAVQQQLKERLAKRIEELRQARKADGGQAPQTRTELMDQRRKRDELRKERKKQIRLQAKAETAKTQIEATQNGSPASKAKPNRVSTVAPANYSFGQVSFDDGDKLNATLDGVKSTKPRKGPTDVVGALKHAEAKKARLANMSDDKRADIQEKDRWSKALKMASGEKLQDDESLLKKSLKRQEKAKKKSEREWNERKSTVEKSQAMRQKKREANIAARKEQKKAGKSGKKAKKVPSNKSKGRAGFEGTGFGGAGKKKK
ncbi:hypothetical protein ABW20_dc0109143 [Dactylellina cionopaga]|nr:hypothetical protein ABW20_dc0109143 [Dactylellina cionopaga]